MAAWGDPKLRPVRGAKRAAAPPMPTADRVAEYECPRIAAIGVVQLPRSETPARVVLTSHQLLWRAGFDRHTSQAPPQWRPYEWRNLRVLERRRGSVLHLEHHVPHDRREEFALISPHAGLMAFSKWATLVKDAVYLTKSWAGIAAFDRQLDRSDMMSRLTEILSPGERVELEQYFALMRSATEYRLITAFLTNRRLVGFDGSEFFGFEFQHLRVDDDGEYPGGVRVVAHVLRGRRRAITFLDLAALDARAVPDGDRFVAALRKRLT